VSACGVCGAQGTVALFAVTGNADGDLAPRWTIRGCGACGSGTTDPVPDDATLSGFYATGVYEKPGGRAPGIARVLDALLDRQLDEIGRVRRPPGRLLDVGCGKGRFLARASARGWRAIGMERMHPQAVVARRNAPDASLVESELALGPFRASCVDAVTAWHVLEHLSDPGAALAAAFEALRPGGVLACEVPNFGSWQARAFGASSFHLDPPRHLVHFTQSSLARLAESKGFRVVRVRTFSPALGPFGMLQSALTAAGFPHSLLFRWLKRSAAETGGGTIAACVATAALAAGPALAAEALAAATGNGGVVRLLAVRP
jgi:SAM-dependent methyltransferase